MKNKDRLHDLGVILCIFSCLGIVGHLIWTPQFHNLPSAIKLGSSIMFIVSGIITGLLLIKKKTLASKFFIVWGGAALINSISNQINNRIFNWYIYILVFALMAYVFFMGFSFIQKELKQ